MFQGRPYAYTALSAARDTIEEIMQSGKDLDELFKTVRRQARLVPNEIVGLDEVTRVETWEEFLKDTCMRILIQEVEADNPQLVEIDRRRRVEFDS